MTQTYVITTRSAASRHDWQDLISRVYTPVDIDIGEADAFEGVAALSEIGAIQIARVASGGEHAQRKRHHIALDPTESTIIALVQHGTVTLSQCGRSVDVGPGSLAMLDLASPYSVRHTQPTECVFLKVPTHLLKLRLADLPAYYATHLHAQTGIARIGADLVVSLSENCENIDLHSAERLCGDMIDILALAFEGRSGAPSHDNTLALGALRQRALGVIERNLGDPALSPAGVAQALKISVRYLHQVFAGDLSVSETIRKLRLQRCHDMLCAPEAGARRIHQIAEQYGFRNMSHFSTSFRDEFGYSPRELRGRSELNPSGMI